MYIEIYIYIYRYLDIYIYRYTAVWWCLMLFLWPVCYFLFATKDLCTHMHIHMYIYAIISNYCTSLFFTERERATWVCLKIGFSNLHPSANSLSTCSTAICYTQFVDGSCQGRGGSPWRWFRTMAIVGDQCKQINNWL